MFWYTETGSQGTYPSCVEGYHCVGCTQDVTWEHRLLITQLIGWESFHQLLHVCKYTINEVHDDLKLSLIGMGLFNIHSCLCVDSTRAPQILHPIYISKPAGREKKNPGQPPGICVTQLILHTDSPNALVHEEIRPFQGSLVLLYLSCFFLCQVWQPSAPVGMAAPVFPQGSVGSAQDQIW